MKRSTATSISKLTLILTGGIIATTVGAGARAAEPPACHRLSPCRCACGGKDRVVKHHVLAQAGGKSVLKTHSDVICNHCDTGVYYCSQDKQSHDLKTHAVKK